MQTREDLITTLLNFDRLMKAHKPNSVLFIHTDDIEGAENREKVSVGCPGIGTNTIVVIGSVENVDVVIQQVKEDYPTLTRYRAYVFKEL